MSFTFYYITYTDTNKTFIQVLQTPVRVENSIINFHIVTTGVYVTTIYVTKLQSKLTMTIRDVTKSSSRQTMFTVKNFVCVCLK